VSEIVKENNVAAVVESIDGFSEATVRAASAAKNEPEWMLEKRLAAWQLFEEMPWPRPTDEAWRRTRLTGFDLAKTPPCIEPQTLSTREELSKMMQEELDEMESAASLIFQSGIKEHFMTSVVTPDLNKFSALHAALWDTGAFIYVPANTKVELPLQVILNQVDESTSGYHHTLLVAEEGAEVTLVDDLMGGTDGMQNSVVELIAGDNSVVRYMNLQDFDHSTWNFINGRAALGRDTDLRWIQVSWGSRLTKAFLDLDLMGEGGHGEMLGIYFPVGRQHIDHQTLQIHRVPNGFSDLLFNGALKNHARSVYMGIIKVHPDAQKTDSFQRNGNLILDSTARGDSIPGLEIEADDVRCTHAATASQVEEEYLFYLMARGQWRVW